MTGELKRGMRIVMASHNEGKVREIAALLAPFGIDCSSAGALGLAEPEETAESFIDNAKLKAIAAACASGLPALADDSGLEVAALGGAPGIHSARWSGPHKDFGVAIARVHDALEAKRVTDGHANFTCALALAAPHGEVQAFEGKVFGTLVWPPRGSKGFGYDPIFVPDGFNETFGEMEPGLKDTVSHRARAFEKLMLTAYDDDA
jgi:XTP/dITP diphosphohydrolase